MRKRGIEETVDVHVVLEQLVVALIVFASGPCQSESHIVYSFFDLHWLLHALELFFGLVVLLPTYTQLL
jgi:hypothetical protein